MIYTLISGVFHFAFYTLRISAIFYLCEPLRNSYYAEVRKDTAKVRKVIIPITL